MITKQFAIHVFGPHLQANKQDGGNRPLVIVRRRESPADESYVVRRLEITGPSTFVHQPERPLPGGAVAWVETNGPVLAFHDDGRVDTLGG